MNRFIIPTTAIFSGMLLLLFFWAGQTQAGNLKIVYGYGGQFIGEQFADGQGLPECILGPRMLAQLLE